MNELDIKQKEEIKKIVEYVFAPIEGELVSFGKPHDIYSATRTAYSTENIFIEKNKTTFYPLEISTKLGTLNLSVRSNELNDLKSAIATGFAYSHFFEDDQITNELSLEIQKRIYS